MDDVKRTAAKLNGISVALTAAFTVAAALVYTMVFAADPYYTMRRLISLIVTVAACAVIGLGMFVLGCIACKNWTAKPIKA